MTLAGYQSPVEFKIEMDWEKIYNHDIFNAGVATPVLQAEIGIATQQLRETGAIKITQIGEDPNMQRLQELLTNKMIDMCFVPFGREGSPNWTELAQPLNGGRSYLDRATEQLNNERERQRTSNQQIRAENRETARNNSAGGGTGSQTGGTTTAGGGAATAATTEAEEETSTGTAVREGMVSPSSGSSSSTGLGPALTNPASYRNSAEPIPDRQPAPRQEEGLQSMNIVASYQKKTIQHTGKYTAEARTYFTTSLTEVFGGNIGKINCKDCLREVNLDDPLYKQRELVCFIDGEISQDFNKYINYVTVSMRKKHPGGDLQQMK